MSLLNLFELTLRFNGFRIAEAKKRLKEIQGIPEEEYEKYTIDARREIVDFHLNENPFYKSFVGKKAISNWEDVPIMQKKDLQKPLAQRLSYGFTPKNTYVNKTSGSSGHPFVFAKDKLCHALTWAEILDRFGWFAINFNTSFQARFYGIPLTKIGYQKERLKDLLSSRFRFPIFDLSEEKMESFLKSFRRKKFDYINGYTSSIVLFAKFLKKKNIVLTAICPSLKYCIVTSEMLYDDDKKLMETTFGVPVINEYGASELDLIAFTNLEDEFLVNSETLYVEILDEHYRPVPNGKSGGIFITSLYNKAHPLIRYDIGDTGVLAKHSTFKKPILERLIGRTNDIAKLPSGKNVPGLAFYYVTKSVIEDNGNIKEFLIEQITIDTFRIIYVSERELTSEEMKVIKKACFTYLEDSLKIEFERTSMLDRSNRGKLKQFTSKI
jgi:phenylacetate-CoA ligase